MFNKFQGKVITDKSGHYIDLTTIFPKNVFAFFLIDKEKRKTKEEIENFLIERKIKPNKICALKQIHSDVIVEEEDGVEGDGLYTKSIGTAITIAVADCVPILISANNGSLLIAIHSGWKGTFSKIVEKGVSLFNPRDCDAVWIGPSIRSCCYDVALERVESFKEKFPNSKGVLFKELKLDLPLINAEILSDLGIPPQKIYLDQRCTFCDENNFASYRRDKDKAGRMFLVALKSHY
ncbi:MAG: peptidoglycan editing factor PgeF [Thermoanaerobaculaceae bacterium]|nr:peptidoglycan editing factor PgeF [Thermoanaerobaculaceae bacterium]